MRVGVDTGGTFTDCVVLDRGRVRILKVFTAPDAAQAALEGVRRLAAMAGQQGPHEIIHGTTVGTNTLLERRGGRVGLITTAGFEDLIEIGRQARPRLYDLSVEQEPPLVPRSRRWGVEERTVAGGRVLDRPTARALEQLSVKVRKSRVESVAVCLIFSFANPANERAVARALRKLNLPVSLSHAILPEFREYERLSTVVVNAYLAPRLGEYLSRLERRVTGELSGPLSDATRSQKTIFGRTDTGSPKPKVWQLYVMQSSGGITTGVRAALEPVRTILSGPAGGVVAAAWLARSLGVRRVISFDMGGTSTDVCLLDGSPRTTSETVLAGLPVAVPVLDVHSVGAGGGSIARLDRGGALRVGPGSAGASPGPLCYGRGGSEPTVTDANLLLGRLDADFFLGGQFRLDEKKAERGFAEFLRRTSRAPERTRPAFQTPIELAQGIVAVSNATMEKALRVISVERGYDPRDFALVSFGGSGGLHAADLARSLRLASVIVPQNPGAFSAFGILCSDIVKDVSQSVLLRLSSNTLASGLGLPRTAFRDLDRRYRRLEAKGREEMRTEGTNPARAVAERRLDVRYTGQSYELSLPFSRSFPARFHQEHERAYGHAQPGHELEVVNLRVRLAVRTTKPRPKTHPARASANARAALLKRKMVWFERQSRTTAIYDRARLLPGARLEGPAVVVEYSSTTVVPPDFVCMLDESLSLVLHPRGG